MDIWNKELLEAYQRHQLERPSQLLMRKGADAELYLYNMIGPKMPMGGEGMMTCASDVVACLKDCQGAKTLTVHINSPGGEVFEGLAIYNELARFPAKKTVVVDGIAASIASVIAMAGDRIVMAPGSEMMIHEAHTIMAGNATDLRKTADRLEQANGNIRGIYSARTKQPDDQLQKLMAGTTYMTADQAVALGFADCVEERQQMKNQDPIRIQNKLSDLDLWRLRAQLVAKR